MLLLFFKLQYKVNLTNLIKFNKKTPLTINNTLPRYIKRKDQKQKNQINSCHPVIQVLDTVYGYRSGILGIFIGQLREGLRVTGMGWDGERGGGRPKDRNTLTLHSFYSEMISCDNTTSCVWIQ